MSDLYISDLDGTLLDCSCKVSDYSRNTLNSLINKGLEFTVATARTIASAGKILDGINLNLPVILMNGVLIFNPLTKIYEHKCVIDKDTVKQIISVRKDLGIDCFMYTLKDNLMHTYFENISSETMENFYLERVNRYYKTFEKTDNFLNIQNEIIYFTFIDTKEKLQPLYDRLKDNKNLTVTFYQDVYNPRIWYFECFSSEASKKNGVLWIKEKYGFDRIYAFGDNTNDIPMLEISDFSYCVKNGTQQVKKICGEEILSNNDDGVVKKILEILKEGENQNV